MTLPVPTVADFFHACSEHWSRVGSVTGVRTSVYKVALVPKTAVVNPIFLPVGEIACVVYWGSIRYSAGAFAPVEFGDGSAHPVISAKFDEKETKSNTWLIVMAPFQEDGSTEEEPKLRARIKTALGLLSATIGQNIAYEHLEEFSLDLGKDEISSVTNSWRSPFVFPLPDLSVGAMQATKAIATALASEKSTVRDRLSLALRWYRQSLEADGIDAFLKGWIALEVLAMPKTDITPLCESLGRAYALAPADAKSQFLVGRLYGIRSRIVHSGQPQSIDFSVTNHLSAVFVDVFLEVLGQPPLHRTRGLFLSTESDPTSAISRALAS